MDGWMHMASTAKRCRARAEWHGYRNVRYAATSKHDPEPSEHQTPFLYTWSLPHPSDVPDRRIRLTKIWKDWSSTVIRFMRGNIWACVTQYRQSTLPSAEREVTWGFLAIQTIGGTPGWRWCVVCCAHQSSTPSPCCVCWETGIWKCLSVVR